MAVTFVGMLRYAQRERLSTDYRRHIKNGI
jgi:hypothetical protein